MISRSLVCAVASIIAAFSLAAPATLGPPELGKAHPPEIPIGKLGYRLGTYLTIEGVPGKGKFPPLLVDRIGEYKLKEPVAIVVSNCRLPLTNRCTLKGFETGGWVGVPPTVVRVAGERFRTTNWVGTNVYFNTPAPQLAAWWFEFVFEVYNPEDFSPNKRQ